MEQLLVDSVVAGRMKSNGSLINEYGLDYAESYEASRDSGSALNAVTFIRQT